MNDAYLITGQRVADTMPQGLTNAGSRVEGVFKDHAAPMRAEAI